MSKNIRKKLSTLTPVQSGMMYSAYANRGKGGKSKKSLVMSKSGLGTKDDTSMKLLKSGLAEIQSGGRDGNQLATTSVSKKYKASKGTQTGLAKPKATTGTQASLAKYRASDKHKVDRKLKGGGKSTTAKMTGYKDRLARTEVVKTRPKSILMSEKNYVKKDVGTERLTSGDSYKGKGGSMKATVRDAGFMAAVNRQRLHRTSPYRKK